MTLLLSFGGTLSVGSESLASNLGTIEVTDDSATIELTVDIRAAVAFASRFQRLGVRVDYDRGDGVMVTLPDHEVGNSLVIEESTETYGDRLSLRLLGERWSPFARKILQAKTEIHVYFITGSPQNEFATRVFTGHVVTANYTVQPPSAEVTCLDAAALYAEKRAKDWSLEPNSGATRLSVTLELLALGEIPIRSIDLGGVSYITRVVAGNTVTDWPEYGSGGNVNKPHTLGDRPILDFLRDFLAVIGVEIGFESGGFVARRYDASAASVLELNPSNLLPQISLQATDTLAANVLGVVSVSATRTELGGLSAQQEELTETFAEYGAMAEAGPLTPTFQKVYERRTLTTNLGTLAVHVEQTEKEFYSVLAAGVEMDSFGDVGPASGTVYVYPDGSTRADPVETFRRVRKLVRDKEIDADNNVIRIVEARYFFHFLKRALYRVLAGVDEPHAATIPIPINDDGDGVIGGFLPTGPDFSGREVMGLFLNDAPTSLTMEGGLSYSPQFLRPDALTETDFTLNDDGAIVEERVTEHFYDIGQSRRKADDLFGHGIEDTKYTNRPSEAYWSLAQEWLSVAPPDSDWGGVRVTTKRYRSIDEDRYESVEIVRIGAQPPVITRSEMIGSLPRPERAEPTQTAQEIRAIYEDRERIALAGEEIEDVEHNEYIETQPEAEAYAKHRARLASAIRLDCVMPIEGLLHKWRQVTVNIPGASIDGLRFVAQVVTRDAASFSQHVLADHYSPGI